MDRRCEETDARTTSKMTGVAFLQAFFGRTMVLSSKRGLALRRRLFGAHFVGCRGLFAGVVFSAAFGGHPEMMGHGESPARRT